MNPESALDLMLTVMTYGDSAAGNILVQAMGIIGNDPRVSQETRRFILSCFYVDDGLTSSQSKEVLEKVNGELGQTFARYNFKVKHIIKNWMASKGITNSDTIELILGL